MEVSENGESRSHQGFQHYFFGGMTWMIWRHPHLRKPPYGYVLMIFDSQILHNPRSAKVGDIGGILVSGSLHVTRTGIKRNSQLQTYINVTQMKNNEQHMHSYKK